MKNTIKANVVMLNAKLGESNLGFTFYNRRLFYYEYRIDTYQAQHLYLTLPYDKDNSLTHIKEGDYFVGFLNQIEQCSKLIDKGIEVINGGYYNTTDERFDNTSIKSLKKIIVSTDVNLNLPLIPEDFIKQYVESNGSIKEVLVEVYDETRIVPIETWKIKTTPSNYCIISSIKETFTREDMIKCFEEGKTYGHYQGRITILTGLNYTENNQYLKNARDKIKGLECDAEDFINRKLNL